MEVEEKRVGFMREAVNLAHQSVLTGGGPFGCVIVKEDSIVGRGHNRVTIDNDPTAHAEIVAIRDACSNTGSFQLPGCEVYCSCEPCPMCLGALYWARPDRIFFAATQHDAAKAGFDDAHIYSELSKEHPDRRLPISRITLPGATDVFGNWLDHEAKTPY